MKFLDVPRSGSYQGITSSRNRFGQYVRTRATPVNPGSSFQAAVRARMSTLAASWRSLTAVQREGWQSLGAQMTRTDALGQVYDLTGFQAFVSVNSNRAAAADAEVPDAPALSIPDSILTVTPTISAAAFSVAYVPTPMGAAERIFISASPQRSAGRAYEGDVRLIAVSAAAAASPNVITTAYAARFGTPVVGNRIFVVAQRYTLGFMSPAIISSAIVA